MPPTIALAPALEQDITLRQFIIFQLEFFPVWEEGAEGEGFPVWEQDSETGNFKGEVGASRFVEAFDPEDSSWEAFVEDRVFRG
jgi:hypothetical protein